MQDSRISSVLPMEKLYTCSEPSAKVDELN